MADSLLSLAEKTFILHGVEGDFRCDGRRRLEYRSFEIETNLMPQTNGSARLKIGNTDVLVTVKVEVDSPFLDRPNEGKLEFFVDCSANATPEFEGKGGDDLGLEIGNILSNAYHSSNAIDLSVLSILPNKKCWKIYVDVLILQCGGNLFDAVGVAVKCALFTTEIPKVTTAILDGEEADIKLSDDPLECIKLNAENYPVLVTLCKIGDNCVIDPTTEEEICGSVCCVLSVTTKGRITSVSNIGYGSLQASTVVKALEIGGNIGRQLNDTIIQFLKKEDSVGSQRQIFGFLR